MTFELPNIIALINEKITRLYYGRFVGAEHAANAFACVCVYLGAELWCALPNTIRNKRR